MTVSPTATRARPDSGRMPWLLLSLETGIALNAVGGAIYGLAGADEIPREWLAGTPFDSYTIPSLILLVAVGGGMSLAALALLAGRRLAPELAVGAGLILCAWITAQVVVIVPDGGFSWLQPAMFAAGVLVMRLAERLRHQRAWGER
jgi:hypothetical protein